MEMEKLFIMYKYEWINEEISYSLAFDGTERRLGKKSARLIPRKFNGRVNPMVFFINTFAKLFLFFQIGTPSECDAF